MYSVYVLKSASDNRLYVGMSGNVERRVSEHNNGYVFSTKAYRPWLLVYSEAVTSRIEARKREKYFKSGSGKEFLKSILH